MEPTVYEETSRSHVTEKEHLCCFVCVMEQDRTHTHLSQQQQYAIHARWESSATVLHHRPRRMMLCLCLREAAAGQCPCHLAFHQCK